MIILFLLMTTSPLLIADECLELAIYEMNDAHSTGCGCQDGVFNAISASMIGWGVGLFAGIALLTGLVHNSHVHSSSSSSNNSSN
jgi:hypothetical protein